MADIRYPLNWPEGWKRTPLHRRGPSRFRVSETTSRNMLLNELRLFGAQNVILSTSVALRLDGLPYANQKPPEDTGVAVYWVRKGENENIACDVYRTIGENYRALAQAIEAFRMLDRCGASEILKRVYTGFVALPAPGNWRVTLGLAHLEQITQADVEAAYRKKALTTHPDQGGSTEEFVALTKARDDALREVS